MKQATTKVVLIVALSLLAVTCESPKSSASPNVLLITIDTLRADHLSLYGYSQETSPALDALGKEGLVFERMYAQRGLTWPSLASILTSQYPHQHGVRDNWMMLSGSEPTLASVLGGEGYECAAFLTNTSEQQYAGFDLIQGEDALPYANDIAATQNALEWFRSRSKQGPFFVWVHYVAPHAPYDPPEPFASRFLSPGTRPVDTSIEALLDYAVRGVLPEPGFLDACEARYDGEIAFVDNEINTLLEALRELGLFEETVIAVASDHGEELFQHNTHHGHYPSVFSAVNQIPLVVRLPRGTITARCTRVVQAIDIAPTLLAAAGFDAPEAFQGVNLLDVVDGAPDGEAFAVTEWEDKILTITTAEYLYVDNPLHFNPTIGHAKLQPEYRDAVFEIAEAELYALADDPAEQVNIVDANGKEARRLRNKLDEWAERSKWERGTETARRELDEETRRALEDMGYLR